MQNRVGSLWKQLPTGIDERYVHMYGAWCQHVGWVVWVGGMHSAGAGCVSVRVSQCSFPWWKWWLEMDCNELKNVVTKYFVTLFWDSAIQYLWQFSCWKMGEDNQVLVSCHNYIVTNPTVSVSIGLWHIFIPHEENSHHWRFHKGATKPNNIELENWYSASHVQTYLVHMLLITPSSIAHRLSLFI